MEQREEDGLDMIIHSFEEGPRQDDHQMVRLSTSRGLIDCRLYAPPSARQAVVLVGGVGGGWDTPARGLYPRLSADLAAQGVAALRVRYRDPTVLEEATLDVLAGLAYLSTTGVEEAALVGHSFGGAVAIQAAASNPVVRTVVALATQSYGVEPVALLGPDCSILLVHGTADETLPPVCSVSAYRAAQEPRQLVLYDGADHGLDSVADEVYQLVHEWLITELGGSRWSPPAGAA